MPETAIIWLIAAGLGLVVVVPYALQFRRRQRKAEERKQEARSLGIDRPTGQFPMINQTLCIGCGSCVAACPEGDVLAVIWGRAQVVNGKRCVGHGYCEIACPVGALKVGLGDVRSRPDIPILSPTNETSVPGLFIAGELSGLSLIRHAVAQGKMVIDEIARRAAPPPPDDNLYQVAIVGAGPAGLSAALRAKEHGLSSVVFDQYDLGGTILHYPRQKLVMTQPVEIPSFGELSKEEYTKEALLEILQAACEKNQVTIESGHKLSDIEHQYDLFKLRFDSGLTAYSRFVILALGRRGTPRKLGVPGEELSKVMYQLT
ncbi:MAG: 4Fe-4S dicluster domain-containing protein, partial [Candidatus Zixiibacteriota bacterium]